MPDNLDWDSGEVGGAVFLTLRAGDLEVKTWRLVVGPSRTRKVRVENQLTTAFTALEYCDFGDVHDLKSPLTYRWVTTFDFI